MTMMEDVKELYDKMFQDEVSELENSDPEFYSIIRNFTLGEVPNHGNINEKTRMLIITAVVMGCGGVELFEKIIHGALNIGVEPVKIREIVYQGTPYLGLARVYSFITVMNEVFNNHNISLPLEQQGTVNNDNRLQKGNQKQIDYFGEGMKESWKKGPEEQRHIQKWLADNCFGDYYTRNGLNDKEREMVTFCYIMAQGGCEPQLTAHAMANIALGNDKQFLMDLVSQSIPYIGYPRSLNAITCITDAAEQMKK